MIISFLTNPQNSQTGLSDSNEDSEHGGSVQVPRQIVQSTASEANHTFVDLAHFVEVDVFEDPRGPGIVG